MPLSDLLPPIASRSRSSRTKRRRGRDSRQRLQRRRAVLESLEDRSLLAAFVVITPGDSGSGTCDASACTLRDAIATANNVAGADTITFDPAVTGTITLNPSAGELAISESLTITGPGSGALTIDANASVSNELRVMNIAESAGDVTIEGLTLTGGRVADSLEAGGAIQFLSDGLLTIRDSVVSGSTADRGGGIYSEIGAVEVVNSTISGNVATSGPGGGIASEDADITLTSSDLTNNRSYGSGAGLFSRNTGSVTVTNSTVTDNQITGDAYFGGGLYSGEGAFTISGSTISGNTSLSDAGGIYNYSGALTISHTTISGNTAGDSGAGIFNDAGAISITRSNITDNTSQYGDGGGISNGSGSLTLTRSTVSGNSSVNDGGGISNNNGPIRAVGTTFSGNTSGVDGGAIATITGPVTLTNSTVSGNAANIRGGGIRADSAAVRVVNSTIVNNNGLVDGGGIAVNPNNDGESILLHNSIIALNMSPNGPDFLAPGNPATNLEVVSSLVGNNAGTTLFEARFGDSNGNFVGSPNNPIDPFLSNLGEFGGPTQTHIPIFGSVVINSGSNSLANDFGPDGAPGGGDDTPLVGDQRGGLFGRISDTTVDMGAVEWQPPPALIVDNPSDVVNGDFSFGDRTLRELIEFANENNGADTIQFGGGSIDPIVLDPANGPLVISDSLTLIGPFGDLQVISADPADQFRLINITSTAGDVKLIGMKLTGGNAGSADGGAIHSESSGALVITHSELEGNTGNSGGAIAVTDGTVAIAASTISGNTATGGHGGAIAATSDATDVTLVDATISGNTAAGDGGGIYSQNAQVEVDSSTVTLNQATGTGGGIGLLADGNGEALVMSNGLVAGNTAATGPDFNAPMNTVLDLILNFSLIGDNADTSVTESTLSNNIPQPDARGNLVGGGSNPVIDPGLEPLADNGGPTLTHALLPTSLAINAGDVIGLGADEFDVDRDGNVTEFPIPADQRGAPRFVDTIDIGAVELSEEPSVTWNNPADIAVGTALSPTQLNASSPVSGVFEYTPPAGTILSAGAGQVLSARFIPTDQLTYRSVTTTVTINVVKGDPVITWADPTNISFGTLLSSTQLNATANVAGTFVYDPDVGTQLDVGTHTLDVTFNPDDTANYNSVTESVSLTVDKADPVITWADPAGISFGTQLDSTQLNATSSVDGTFVYSPDTGTVLDAGDNQTLSVTFTPTDGDNYNEVMASVTIDVAKIDPVITWDNPADIEAGTALDSTQLNATANVSGTFVYDPVAGTQLPPGDNQQLNVTFTPDDSNYNTVTDSVLINVTGMVAEPVVTISPSGPGGAADPPDRPSGPQPSSWARQRSQLRQIVVTLGAPISMPAPSELTLTNLGIDAANDPDQEITLTAGHLSLNNDSTELTLSFDYDELTDGVYQLELSSAVTSGPAYTITGDLTNKFFVLTGDWNGTGGVNIQDFATFAYWFGQAVPTAPHYVDVNGTGGINIQDFAGFAGNFGKQVIPAGMSGLNAGGGGEGELPAALRTLLNPTDVDGDGAVTAIDALRVVNRIGDAGSSEAVWNAADVDGNGLVTPRDALLVINRLSELNSEIDPLQAIADINDDDEQEENWAAAVDELFAATTSLS